MTASLDVLLIESVAGAGDADAQLLEAAGHRVHRCYPALDEQDYSTPVPLRVHSLCTGATSSVCPLDARVDVALLVRRRLATRPGAREGGVSCALRAGVPVVEDGPDLLDPYEPWLAGRVADDVVSVCEVAARDPLEPLRREVMRRVGRVLEAAGVDPARVSCRLDAARPTLHVVFTGPVLALWTQLALSVRVLDAVRSAGRTFGPVEISYEVARPDGR